MNVNRLLLLAIVVPSAFVLGVVLLSYAPHREGWLTHGQEHTLLAVAMIVGIVPFAFFMIRLFRRVQRHMLSQNEQLTRRNAEMEAVLTVSRAVEESNDLDTVLPSAVRAVVDATGADVAEIWLGNDASASVSLRYYSGEAEEAFREVAAFPLGDGFPGIVMRTGRTLVTHDLANDKRFIRGRVKAAGFRTYCAVPLRHGGATIGVLGVAARDEDAITTERELRLLQVMADHVAIAVENSRLREEVETLAILTERERIAREMHDGLGQVLGYVNTKAQAVREFLRAGNTEVAVQHMEQLETAARETYDDVREAILALGSSDAGKPFFDSLSDYAGRFSEMSGLPVEIERTGDPNGFNPQTEVQLLRIVQEALANARKHSFADRVVVQTSFTAEGWTISVEDDGVGFDPGNPARGPWPHFGLQSMRERASSIGARFDVRSSPGRGTRIEVAARHMK